jgi:apolipoprotein N-acyltransferase
MLSLFTTWAFCLRAKQGWRRYAAAFVYGALAGLAFPPFNAVPLLWLSFPALVFLLQGISKADVMPAKAGIPFSVSLPDKKINGTPAFAGVTVRAFAVGWSFSFGLLVVSLYWIAGALFVDIKQFWWAVPLAVAGLPAVFAVYYGVAALIAKLWGLERLDGLLVLALAWFLADYGRGHLMTGFPWDVTGYVWGDVLPVMQIASVIGIYGLTLLTLVLAVLPARKSALALLAAVMMLFVAIAGWGAWRLSQASNEIVPDVRLRLVQPNVSQANKWRAEKRESQFQQLLENSFAPSSNPPTAIIWPETATGFYLAEDPEHLKAIAARMTLGQSVITGVVYRGINANGTLSFYNSLIAIDDQARITAGYDKFHLVPFGEYMPFRSILPIHAVAAISDFTPGEGPKTLRVAGLLPFSPLVCYEAIFPDEVIDGDDPQFMLNVTNDAWYEHTTGPAQHFIIARTRAVEEGMPLVRVANKGVTAVVDAYGRIAARASFDKAEFVDSNLPRALQEFTLFRRFHDWPLWALCGLLLALAGLLRVRARKR